MPRNQSFKKNKLKFESLQEDFSTESNPRKKRSKQKGHHPWTLSENLIYCECLLELTDQFESEFQRRSSRVFRKISSLLDNRTPEQCRSHHQKMIKSYCTLQGILTHFREMEQIDRQNQEKLKAKEFSMTSQHLELTNEFSNQEFNKCQDQVQVGEESIDANIEFNQPLNSTWDDVFNF